MHAFIYIITETISEEEYITATNFFKTTKTEWLLDKYQKIVLD